jgi:hypothetical protein
MPLLGPHDSAKCDKKLRGLRDEGRATSFARRRTTHRAQPGFRPPTQRGGLAAPPPAAQRRSRLIARSGARTTTLASASSGRPTSASPGRRLRSFWSVRVAFVCTVRITSDRTGQFDGTSTWTVTSLSRPSSQSSLSLSRTQRCGLHTILGAVCRGTARVQHRTIVDLGPSPDRNNAQYLYGSRSLEGRIQAGGLRPSS